MSTTRWSDTETSLLDSAIALLMDPVSIEDKAANISWENWNFTKVFTDNQSMQLNGRNIQYNILKQKFLQLANQ